MYASTFQNKKWVAHKRVTRHIIVLTVLIAMLNILSGVVHAKDLTGAGASFPFPVYAKWAEIYYRKTGIAVNYQSIGSRGGINQMRAGTVDFGATDVPLTKEILEKDGFLQFPTVLGGLVPVFNVEGIKSGELKLTGPILADIYLGKITQWDDPTIKELNPLLNLPSAAIVPVYRSDGSGATQVFTAFLSDVSQEWKNGPGEASAIAWSVGQGGKGNEGVAALVKQVTNSIGYVESAFASQNGLAFPQLQNRAGFFVLPESETFQAAAKGADWSKTPGFGISLVNQDGEKSWPITAPTFILIPGKTFYAGRTYETLKFFDWAFSQGDEEAEKLDYVPLPDEVKNMVREAWRMHVRDAKGTLLWP